MQWAGVGMWMVFGLSACSPTKTEIGNLNVIPQPQEVSQDIQAKAPSHSACSDNR